MTTQPVTIPSATKQSLTISRRRILRAVGGGALVSGAVLATSWGAQVPGARAQASGPTLADHPLVGAWLVSVPQGPNQPPVPNLQTFTTDGVVLQAVRAVQLAPPGQSFQFVYTSGGHGIWMPTSERGGVFTFVFLNTNERGEYIGTTTVTGHPQVSEDGQTFTNDPASPAKRTIRTPDGTIVSEQFIGADGPPATARRITLGE
jgi:hypothetical protein